MEKIREIMAAIQHELLHEGNCTVVFCGKLLKFHLEVYGCDIYVDGNFADCVTHDYMIQEFLEDIWECQEVPV